MEPPVADYTRIFYYYNPYRQTVCFRRYTTLSVLRASDDAAKSKQQLKSQNSHSKLLIFCYFSQGMLHKKQYKKYSYKNEFSEHIPHTTMMTITSTY